MSIERRMRERVHYGWIVVAVTFVTLLAAAGIRSAPGVLIIPLEREFGWTRATVSFAVSINLFLYGLSGPFIAGLMDRLGIRRVMVTSLALVATGVALTTLMTASWQLALLWGVVEEAFRLLRAELQSTGGEAVSVAPAERLAFAIEGPRLVAGDFAPRGSDDTQVIRDGRQHRL